MDSKTCSRCKQEKLLSDFHFKNSESRYNSWCKSCLYELQKERWKLRKLKVLKMFGGKCSVCGYNKNIAALNFHHVDPNEKDFVWNRLRQLKWASIIKELKRCQLVCSNCHMEIHNPDCNTEVRSLILDNYEYGDAINRVIQPTGKCPVCDDDVYGTKYCSVQHASFGNRVTVRPSKEELEDLLKGMSYCAIGRKYGVSDSAIRKWAKRYEIL